MNLGVLSGWNRRVVIGAVAAAVVPLLVGVVAVLARGEFAVHGDDALLELRVRDVGSADTPLVGSYQRFGWNQPGPLLFYVLALPYRLLGSDFAALQAGALLLGALAVTGIVVVAYRRGGVVLALWSLALVTVLVHAIGATRISDPWEPRVLVLPFAFLLFLAFDAASGHPWTLPLAAGVMSLVAQAYAVLAPAAVALFAWAVLALAVRERARLRPLLKPALVTLAVLAVLWMPALVEQLREDPGNVREMWTFFRAPHETFGVGDAYSAVALQFGTDAPWIRGDVPLAAFSPDVDVDAAPLVPIALLALFAGLGVALGRRDESATLALTVLVAVLAAVVGFSRLVGGLFNWALEWTNVVGLGCWLAAGWCSYRALTARVRDRVTPALVVALAAAVVVFSGLNLVDAVSDDPDRGRVHEALVELGDEAVVLLEDFDGPVLVTSEAVVPEVVVGDGQVGPEVIALALDRAGVDVVVEENLDNRFGDRRAHPDRAVAELRLVAGDPESVPQGFGVVATVDPLTRAERVERGRLEAELDELGGFESLEAAEEAIARDPELRELLDRLAELGDAPPLTLVVREPPPTDASALRLRL
ncbi:MAG: hypothetical protein ACRDY6_24205 [Acidimicrobiia bacterium]